MKPTMTGKSVSAKLVILGIVAVALVGLMLRGWGRGMKAGAGAAQAPVTRWS